MKYLITANILIASSVISILCLPHLTGLQLARLADLPRDVLRYADKAAFHLANLDAVKKQASKTTKVVARRRPVK